MKCDRMMDRDVSTHSRPKAAGTKKQRKNRPSMFQHTAARRRLVDEAQIPAEFMRVSTHSRPKAAGSKRQYANAGDVGFNTQPPEGGWLIKNW